MSDLTKEETREEVREGARLASQEYFNDNDAALKEIHRDVLREQLGDRSSGIGVRVNTIIGLRDEYKLEKGELTGRWVRALLYASAEKGVKGKALAEAAVDMIKEWSKDEPRFGGEVDKYLAEYIEKTMLSSELESGAALIPPAFHDEIIELLRNKTVVRAMGAMTIPVPGGTLHQPKQTGASTAYWVGEEENITASEIETGLLQFTLRRLAAIVPISNDLLRDAGNKVDMLVRDDLVQQMMIAEDLAFLRGAGTDHSPMGIRYQTHEDHVFAAQATDSNAHRLEDISKMIQVTQEANIPMMNMGFIIGPRTERALKLMRDEAGWVYRQEMNESKTVEGYRYMVTNQIPRTLGTNSDETEIYFGDFSQLLIGEGMGLDVQAFPNGTYVDTAGKVRSGISEDVSVIRSIARCDFKMKYTKAFAVLTGVKWTGQP